MNAKLMFVHALTPLHPGTGQGIGVIDLPVAREVATGLPYLPGSSFKGVLRDRANGQLWCNAVFGPDTNNADEHAGTAQFTDMRLLLLPVRSLAGPFAWVTSPFVLRRFARDCKAVGLSGVPGDVQVADNETAVLTSQTALKVSDNQIVQIVLEDLQLKPDSGNADDWANFLAAQLFQDDTDWQETLKKQLCIVADDVLSFLLDTSTEIVARIKLQDDTKTVQKGGLWYEELLPAETVLAGLVVAQPVEKTNLKESEILDKVAELLEKPVFQFGGSATVGRGLCRLVMAVKGG
ncbi:MAG: type III-B CRISPR module RAMP protein Cmr4 [Candidatus Promineifilaceae bacterium]